MLNVGLVGFGFAGKVFHAPVIRAVDGLRLSVIVQRHGPPDPRYPDVEFVRELDDLLSRKVDVSGKIAVAVLSGGNVDPELFHRLVA